ncbi:MAG: sigma-70 family RNA polymerase sigma factor [Anaerolineales bacterium]|nr:sigma-70 family RNA polymerase sigma factor [Chloroflexota bacterium]MBL6980176.1 sigma-70 family RNA polymerase sigma factor [Anaerolineales bacterium]
MIGTTATQNAEDHQISENGFSQLSDDEVVAQASGGDREAFGELYDRYVKRIYNYIYFRTNNPFDAEDLTERVFFRAIRHIENYENRGLPISAWLYRIAHNLVANWYRDNSRRQEIPLDTFDFTLRYKGEHPEVAVLKTEEKDDLLRVIRQLPEDRQQLLILKFAESMTNAEIGQIMDRTEGAIKSLYHRTLMSLREEYNLD